MKFPDLKIIPKGLFTIWLIAAGLLISVSAQAEGNPAQVDINNSGLSITPPSPSDFASMVVQIANPDDSVSEYRSNGETIYWDSNVASDGVYRYEVRVLLTTSSDSEEAQQLYSRTHGWFMVSGGVATPPPGEVSAVTPETSVLYSTAVWLVKALIPSAQAADLTANSTAPQIFLESTVLGASYDIFNFEGNPIGANSIFQLEVNDGSQFSSNEIFNFTVLRDTQSTNPSNQSFTLNVDGDIGLADGSVFIDRSSSRLGIGTIIPTQELHVFNTFTPTIRIDDGTTGVWDITESSDSLRFLDVTDGIFALTLSGTNGQIGMGTTNPLSSLHVLRFDGSAQILVEEANGTVAPRTLFELRNNGNTKFTVNNTDAGVAWAFANSGNDFRLSRQGSGDVEFILSNAGNLTIQGSLTELSSREQKHNITAMSSQTALNKVLALPIKEWSYKDSADNTRHVGPMAEDFYQAFGLGESETGIATLDTSGVALAAIQGLHEKLQQKETQILTLKQEKDAEIGKLQLQLNKLQQLVYQLATKDQVTLVQ
jgi:hypothetical protein